jgi:TRAP-type C4-dicarboxylate transport system substrate-binding protein
MKRVAFAVMLLFATAAHAAVKIKLGTVAPKGSAFEQVLLDMGAKWKPKGVDLKIYAGGARGGEADMVREMRNDVLDAGLLSAIGLSEIDPSVEALQNMPMMFRSLEEVDYIGETLRPRLEKKLRDKGFVVLFWADAGWVRFFSTKPVASPDDLKRLKLFTWAGDPEAVDVYKAGGFHPVPLETNDILPSLQTKMIEAVPLPPYVALATQVFTRANYMMQLDWAPLVGALVVTEKSWNKLTPDVQRELAASAAAAGRAMKMRNRAESDKAVAAMQKRGLKVVPVMPQDLAEWNHSAADGWKMIRGSMVPADLFDEVERLLADYRRAHVVMR